MRSASNISLGRPPSLKYATRPKHRLDVIARDTLSVQVECKQYVVEANLANVPHLIDSKLDSDMGDKLSMEAVNAKEWQGGEERQLECHEKCQ